MHSPRFAPPRPCLAVTMVALVLLGIGSQAQAQSSTFTGLLTGGQEVPATNTRALSFAYFQFLFNDNFLFAYRFNLMHDQDVTGVHIHSAPTGENGSIVLNLRPDGFCVDIGSFLTIYYLTAAQLRGSLQDQSLSDLKALMNTGDTYINLHTDAFPSGWIRGQLSPTGG